MTKLRSILSICLLVLVTLAQARKEENIKINVNGQQRSMICYSPDKPTDDMPLFIITHGMNQDPVYQRDNDKFYLMVDTAKFVLTYLKSDGNTWDIGGQKDLNFVKQTITVMHDRFGIDKSRVYWAGFSMGSMLIYHGIGNGMGDYIAAFAPCSDVAGQPWTSCKKPVNLIHCHSKNDDVFPINQYQPRDFAFHFVDVDKCTRYKCTRGASLPGGWDKGDKERWWNGKYGNEVEIFMCDGGGHWPTQNYVREIWNFCKRFHLPTKAEIYDYTYKNALTLLNQWQDEVTLFTDLKTNFNNLKKASETYAPESVEQEDESALNTAATKLQTAINNFYTTLNTNTKKSKKVTKTDFDPNFHIYLCFGQSNMEGNATPELIDYTGTNNRALMMSPVTMTSYSRTKGSWYMARPPLCREYTGLTPADYFVKTMAKNLPDSITVGVINVALGGCAIEMFNEDGIADYIKKQADWLQGYAKSYGNNPFRYLVDLAKKAQNVGVIKGILLHQGCSNNGQSDWPQKVNLIYTRLLSELGLSADDCPLLVGELLAQNMGGVCYGHNSVIAKVPSTIPSARIVSSKNCPGIADGLHFSAEGYRMIGENYANSMLEFLKRYEPDYTHSIKSMKVKQNKISVGLNGSAAMYVMLTDQSSKTYDVTASCTFTCSQPDKLSFTSTNILAGGEEGDYTVTATYKNEEGEEISVDFDVCVRMFPIANGWFNPSILKTGSLTVTSTSTFFKSVKDGLGGWQFAEPLDLSLCDSLVVDLKNNSLAKPELRIYDVSNPSSASYYSIPMSGGKHFVADLKNMQDAEGRTLDPSHIYIVGIAVQSTSSVYIDNVYVCSEATRVPLVMHDGVGRQSLFDLSGRRVGYGQTKQGIYIRNGKKFIVK